MASASKHTYPSDLSPIDLSSPVPYFSPVRNPGIISDKNLTFSDDIAQLSRSCYMYMHYARPRPSSIAYTSNPKESKTLSLARASHQNFQTLLHNRCPQITLLAKSHSAQSSKIVYVYYALQTSQPFYSLTFASYSTSNRPNLLYIIAHYHACIFLHSHSL